MFLSLHLLSLSLSHFSVFLYYIFITDISLFLALSLSSSLSIISLSFCLCFYRRHDFFLISFLSTFVSYSPPPPPPPPLSSLFTQNIYNYVLCIHASLSLCLVSNLHDLPLLRTCPNSSITRYLTKLLTKGLNQYDSRLFQSPVTILE